MKCKAVVFDLFETLITEWGHEKYTKSKMCADLGLDKSEFDEFWEEKEQDRYTGRISFEDSIRYVCERCGKPVDHRTLSRILDRRIRTKAACFDFVDPRVYTLLGTIRKMGLQTAILSNCSSEEVAALKKSELASYFDTVVLSCEVHMKKPESCIYREAADRLGVFPEECVFVGDGGSHELEGAHAIGMKAIQARWYTNQLPQKREPIPGFPTSEEPLEMIQYIE